MLYNITNKFLLLYNMSPNNKHKYLFFFKNNHLLSYFHVVSYKQEGQILSMD